MCSPFWEQYYQISKFNTTFFSVPINAYGVYLFVHLDTQGKVIKSCTDKAVYSNQTKSLTLDSLGVSLCVAVLNSRIQIDCALHLYHNNQFLSNQWSKCNGSCQTWNLSERTHNSQKKEKSFIYINWYEE